MMPVVSAWLLSPALASTWAVSPASPDQVQLPQDATAAGRALKGRFLHLTDLHPDPLYTFNATEALACHLHPKKDLASWAGSPGLEDDEAEWSAWSTNKGKDEQDKAGYWGTPIR